MAARRRPRTRAGSAGPPSRGQMPGVIEAANGIGLQYRGPAHLAQNVRQVRYENSGRSGGTANPALDRPEPNTAYVVNGRHLYITDEHGRTAYAQTRITPGLPDGVRNNYRQGQSGRTGRSGDEGMHFVGTQFDGPLERINYNPGAGAMNRGAPGFADHETAWANHASPPTNGTVDVAITPEFQPTGNNPRPIRWNGETSYDGGEWQSWSEYNPSHSQLGSGTDSGAAPRHLAPEP